VAGADLLDGSGNVGEGLRVHDEVIVAKALASWLTSTWYLVVCIEPMLASLPTSAARDWLSVPVGTYWRFAVVCTRVSDGTLC
jgi:hypothetical protein